MSERGSFVTEYIYCSETFEALKEVLIGNHKYLCSQAIKAYPDEDILKELPIIAGKIGGSYAGEEKVWFDIEMRPLIESVIKTPIVIAVIPDDKSKMSILRFEPKELLND